MLKFSKKKGFFPPKKDFFQRKKIILWEVKNILEYKMFLTFLAWNLQI